MMRNSRASKPRMKSAVASAPIPTISDRIFRPMDALIGTMPRSAPSTVSPKRPPKPKLWTQSGPATSVEA